MWVYSVLILLTLQTYLRQSTHAQLCQGSEGGPIRASHLRSIDTQKLQGHVQGGMEIGKATRPFPLNDPKPHQISPRLLVWLRNCKIMLDFDGNPEMSVFERDMTGQSWASRACCDNPSTP